MTEDQIPNEVKSAERKRSPLMAFLNHQATAMEETGKAVVSLLPKEFRNHTEKAFEEGKAGWSVLVDGVIDEVQCGLDKLRSKSSEDDETQAKGKIKVDVE